MLYIGVMSGTSCDGVDVVVVDFSAGIDVVASSFVAYSSDIKERLLACIANEPVSISALSHLEQDLGHVYADAVNQLMCDHNIKSDAIRAIGLHGQTIYHQPPTPSANGHTKQIGSATITAAKTKLKVIADFRSRDMAYGGQGAPLAPALHQCVFAQANQHVVVLNLGGIANITSITDDCLLGFDTGPANCLMDLWIKKHHNLDYDHSGQWAQQGTVDANLLKFLLAEPYFSKSHPKSTGRELFNLAWLETYPEIKTLAAVDVQRTLLQLTVDTVIMGIKQLPEAVDKLIVCGGGSHNELLISELEQQLNLACQSSLDYGFDADALEAVLMAWMAKQYEEGLVLDLTTITGTSKPMLYGVAYTV